jgi:hypothetical protein
LCWERFVGILVVLLVAAWGLVLGPALLQSANSPITTERMFRRSLRALGGNRAKPPALGGRNILVPPKPAYPLHGEALTPLGRPVRVRSKAAERRRRSITYLAVFIIATFVLGFLVQPLRFLLVINLFADLLLVAYLGLAMYLSVWPPQGERRERHPVVPAADPQLHPQRVAEGGF